jgi:RNA recognition motif-containing protein
MTVKLYVGNLSRSAREADLENVFNNVGLVMSVAIPNDAQGNRKNYGFVNMGTEEGARSAIQTLNGTMLREMQISVREAGPKD